MRRDGFTLIESLVVLGIIAVALAVTGPAIFEVLSPENRVKASLGTLYSDIVFAQNEAMRQGTYGITYDDPITGTGGGTLRQRKVFLVFEPPNEYRIWRWEDLNGNNVVELGEFAPNMAGGADAPVRSVEMDSRLYYGFDNDSAGSNDVDARACGNESGQPQFDITYVTYGTTDLPTCADENCTSITTADLRYLEFNADGFTDTDFESSEPSGAIYITNGKYSYAVSGNRAGIFNMCMWKWVAANNNWEWIPMR